MEYIKREDFVKKTNAQTFVYGKFIEALNELKNSDLVKTYDGKSINKRFTDKVSPTLPIGVTIEIRPESYTNELNIHLYFDRYGNNSELLESITDPILKSAIRNLNYDSCTEKLYQNKPNRFDSEDSTYLLTDRMFRHKQFVHAVDKTIEKLNGWIAENKKAVEEVDLTYQKYEDLKKHVQEVLDSIPLPLRQYVHIPNPLY